jgi:hypothetical protein
MKQSRLVGEGAQEIVGRGNAGGHATVWHTALRITI